MNTYSHGGTGNAENEPGLRTAVFQPCCILTDILTYEETRRD